MPAFTVVYRTPDSPAISRGVFPGQSETLVRQELVRRGWSVLLVQESKPTLLERIKTFSNGALKLPRFGVSTSELALLCEIFKALYSSGVQMLQIVEMTIDETPNSWLRKKLVLVLEHLRIGDSLADAMSDPRCRRAFPALMVETIRTGEANGRLDDALERLKRTFKRMADTKRDTISALVYPAFTLVVFMGVCSILAIKIPDALNEFIGEAEVQKLMPRIPAAIRLLFTVRQHPAYLLFPPCFLTGFIVLLVVGMRFRATRYALTLVQRRIPIVGKLLELFALVRFIEIVSANHESGIALGESLELVERSVDEAVIERIVARIRANIMTNGISLGVAMDDEREKKVFPGLIRQMIHAGEASGRFTETLRPIMDFYNDQASAQLKRLMDSITPAMLVLLGSVIGPIVVGIYKTIGLMNDAVGSGAGM